MCDNVQFLKRDTIYEWIGAHLLWCVCSYFFECHLTENVSLEISEQPITDPRRFANLNRFYHKVQCWSHEMVRLLLGNTCKSKSQANSTVTMHNVIITLTWLRDILSKYLPKTDSTKFAIFAPNVRVRVSTNCEFVCCVDVFK